MKRILLVLTLLCTISCVKKEEDKTIIVNQFVENIQPIKPHPINCFDLPNILEKVRKEDGLNRVDEINPLIDRKNLEIVVSIIENCGMPTSKNIDKKHIATIFLVLQHGDNYHRKKYFHLIEQAVKYGDLQKSDYALIKDRILVSDGKPQIYGTQLTSTLLDSNKFEVYEIEEPEYVDQRRAEMGLNPINDYLKMWDTSINVKQMKK